MPAYNVDLEKFAGLNAQVVGISVDSVYSHIAWQKHDIGVLDYPLASDFFPHGGVAETFGVLRKGDPIPGISDRAVFIIDKAGTIAWVKTYPLDQTPETEEIFAALRQLEAAAAAR